MKALVLNRLNKELLKIAAETVSGKAHFCIDELLDEPTVIVVVAVSNEKPVGLAYANIIHRPGFQDLMLYEIDVAKEYRRQGAATAIIERLKEVCIERDFKEMFVLTEPDNTAATRLYSQTGGVRENPYDVMFVYKNEFCSK